MDTEDSKVQSGLSNNYYKIWCVSETGENYIAECNDIIDALGMNFNEGTAFKALWRKATLRQGHGKRGSTPLYESEKIFWSARRELIRNGGKV